MKRSRRPITFAGLGFVCVLLVVIGVIAWQRNTACSIYLPVSGCTHLEIADTPKAQAKGLGGRDSLASSQGMLFVYDRPQLVCFWMKDTKFNLDMIWFDEYRNITKIKQDVSPETYPESYCMPNTKYVIELPAGAAKQNQLSVGKNLRF